MDDANPTGGGIPPTDEIRATLATASPALRADLVAKAHDTVREFAARQARFAALTAEYEDVTRGYEIARAELERMRPATDLARGILAIAMVEG